MAEVRTPYLALLGHDDTWEPDFLSELVPALDANPDGVLAFSDHWFMDAAGDIDHAYTDRMSAHWGRSSLPEGRITDVLPLLASQAVPAAISALIRTDVAQRHPIPDACGPAYDLWLHYAMATEGRPYWYSPKRLTRWRFHATSATTAGRPDWYRGAAYTWDAVLAEPTFGAIHDAARRRSATAWLALGKSLLRSGAPREQIVDAAARSHSHVPSAQAWLLGRSPRLFRALFDIASLRRRGSAPNAGR